MSNLLRRGLLSMCLALLLSCGGGGGGGGGIVGLGAGVAGTPSAPAISSPGSSSSGSSSSGSSSSASSVPANAGSSAAAAAAPSSGGAAGAGLGGIASNTEGGSTTATAAAGDDGSGVGSGGTGVSTADATGVGAVDGAGSIIVNGLRYATDSTVANIEDASAGLQLGMSVKVTGPVNADFTSGIARRVDSAADLRGPLASVNLKQGSFVMLGTVVTTDEATVWADASGLAALVPGRTLQVWGLPGAPGELRATRVEQREAASTLILTGTVQGLDAAAGSFTLGGLRIDYRNASLSGSLDGRPLADGTLVRVRASATTSTGLVATSVQWWYPVPLVEGATGQIAGIVTGYAGLGSFKLLGIPVDASTANITGGPASGIGNGVRLEVGGVVTRGVLRVTKLKIRHVPGAGGPASFDLIGTVGSFRSTADFRVRGQPVDASDPGVVFGNGTAANLGNGAKVEIHGTEVVNGVLKASQVVFQ